MEFLLHQFQKGFGRKLPCCVFVPEHQKDPNLKDIIEEFQSKEPKKSDNDGENVEHQSHRKKATLVVIRRVIVFTHHIKRIKIQARIHSTFNIHSDPRCDPSLSFHSVVGPGSYTTSTTNMYV